MRSLTALITDESDETQTVGLDTRGVLCEIRSGWAEFRRISAYVDQNDH